MRGRAPDSIADLVTKIAQTNNFSIVVAEYLPALYKAISSKVKEKVTEVDANLFDQEAEEGLTINAHAPVIQGLHALKASVGVFFWLREDEVPENFSIYSTLKEGDMSIVFARSTSMLDRLLEVLDADDPKSTDSDDPESPKVIAKTDFNFHSPEPKQSWDDNAYLLPFFKSSIFQSESVKQAASVPVRLTGAPNQGPRAVASTRNRCFRSTNLFSSVALITSSALFIASRVLHGVLAAHPVLIITALSLSAVFKAYTYYRSRNTNDPVRLTSRVTGGGGK